MKLFKSFTNIREAFGESKIAFKIFFVMLLPVVLFLLAFELFIDQTVIRDILNSSQDCVLKNHKIDTYILYLTSGITHLIISSIVIFYLRRKLYSTGASIKKRVLKIRTSFFIFLIVLIFQVIDNIDLNLGLLSHNRIYSVLIHSQNIGFLFNKLPSESFIFNFYTFSIISFGLISFGLIVIIFTCLNIGKDLSNFLYSFKSGEYTSFEGRNKLIRQIKNFHTYLYLLSSVLVTSTIATILFFQLPLSQMAYLSEAYNSFSKLSTSMSLTWGIIFSLTMLFMCFYPFHIIQQNIKKVKKEYSHTTEKEIIEWFDEVENNYIIHKDLKSMISVFLPTFIGLMPQFL